MGSVLALAPRLRAASTLSPTIARYVAVLNGSRPASTARTYQSRLAALADILGGDRRLADLTLADLELALAAYRTWRGANTAAHWCSAVRGFFAWCVEAELLERSPAERLRAPKRTPPAPRGISAPQAQALLDRLSRPPEDREGWRAVRDASIVWAMLAAGLRRAEAAALAWGDVDREGGLLRVVGKGAKLRTVPIAGGLGRQLDRLWDVCGRTSWPVFPAEVAGKRAGAQLHPNSINMLFRRWVGMAITPHQLRHAFAQALNEAGVGIDVVQDLLGHTNVQTTKIYYGRPPARRMRAAVDQLPWC